MLDHLDRHKILSSLNHGFRSGNSCETQLVVTAHDLLGYNDRNKQVDTMILYFSKAFDTVPHQRLLLKLENYGIRGPILNLITKFLTQREMCIVVEGEKSRQAPVGSGVPPRYGAWTLAVSMPYQRSSRKGQVSHQTLRRWLSPVQGHQHYQRPSYPPTRFRQPSSMGTRLGNKVQMQRSATYSVQKASHPSSTL